MTDSVCTAYENKSVKLCDISEMSQSSVNVENETLKNANEKEAVFTPVTNLTSMLGGERLKRTSLISHKMLTSLAF